MTEFERTVGRLAGEQHGLIASHQLTALAVGPGFAHDRIARGQWRRLWRGLYAVEGAPRTLHQRIMAAQLAAGPGALVSHRTALFLHGVWSKRAMPIEVSIDRGRTHGRPGVIVHESRDLDKAAPMIVDGITVTGLSRAVLDLGAVEPQRVRSTVWAARRERSLRWHDLLDALVDHSRRGRSGIGPLRRVVAVHYGEPVGDSATEDHAFRLLHDSTRVPSPKRQVPVLCADGVLVHADLGWPRRRVVIEIEGVDHLTNQDLQHLDRHRRNQMELAGWSVLVYTGQMLRERPDQFVADARSLLDGAGWRS